MTIEAASDDYAISIFFLNACDISNVYKFRAIVPKLHINVDSLSLNIAD